MRDDGAWPVSPRVPVYLEPWSRIREISLAPFSAILNAVEGSSAPNPAGILLLCGVPGLGGPVS